MTSMSALRTECSLADYRISLPNYEGDTKVDTKLLLELIPESATAVVFFGSSIRAPSPPEARGRSLWDRIWGRCPVERGPRKTANDVDVVTIVPDGEVPSRKEVALMQLRSDGYGTWNYRRGSFHVGIVSETQLTEAARSGFSTALSILREGVLFAGETSLPLESKRQFVLLQEDRTYRLDPP